jgi:hypothetical protein
MVPRDFLRPLYKSSSVSDLKSFRYDRLVYWFNACNDLDHHNYEKK